MQSTYISGANNTGATGGQVLNATGTDVEIFKIVVGAPVASANIWIYGEINPGSSSNTTGIVSKMTLPGSLATGQLPFVIDLTDEHGNGLVLNGGGNVMIDQTLQLTVEWDLASPQQSGS